MSDRSFYTVILSGSKVVKNDEIINNLDKNAYLIPEEKTGVRKQIDVLKQALEKLTLDDFENSIYHLKIAKLRFIYFARRNADFTKFIKNEVEKFENDIIKINKINLEENLKEDLFKNAKQVFKDFLNGVIIKSYHPKKHDNH